MSVAPEKLGVKPALGLLHEGVLASSCEGGRSLMQSLSRKPDWTSVLASPQWGQWMLGTGVSGAKPTSFVVWKLEGSACAGGLGCEW